METQVQTIQIEKPEPQTQKAKQTPASKTSLQSTPAPKAPEQVAAAQQVGFFKRLGIGLRLGLSKAASHSGIFPISVSLKPLPDEGKCKVFEVIPHISHPINSLEIRIFFPSGLPGGTSVRLYTHPATGSYDHTDPISTATPSNYYHTFAKIPANYKGELRLMICGGDKAVEDKYVSQISSTGLIVVATTLDLPDGPPATQKPLIIKAQEIIRIFQGD